MEIKLSPRLDRRCLSWPKRSTARLEVAEGPGKAGAERQARLRPCVPPIQSFLPYPTITHNAQNSDDGTQHRRINYRGH